MLAHDLISTREGSVPQLGLATYRTLANCYGGIGSLK